jgi:hypothetical protein
MKKLIFISVILFSVILITGCGARNNTVHFNPIETPEEKVNGEPSDSASSTDTTDNTASANEEADQEPGLSVTSFAGDSLNTTAGYHVIRGTTPKNTHTIKINDYTLSKYNAGQTEWSYIASAALGTLNEGDNKYTVQALDDKGNEIGSKNFTISYQSPDNLPTVGGSGWVALIISFVISAGYFVIKKLRKVYIKNI